jgi:hypothetical protein
VHRSLDHGIGVRIPASQPNKRQRHNNLRAGREKADAGWDPRYLGSSPCFPAKLQHPVHQLFRANDLVVAQLIWTSTETRVRHSDGFRALLGGVPADPDVFLSVLLESPWVTASTTAPAVASRRYSCLSATTGSTRIARRAGIKQPSVAETINAADATTRVIGSAGDTCTKTDLRVGVTAKAAASPIVRPIPSGAGGLPLMHDRGGGGPIGVV